MARTCKFDFRLFLIKFSFVRSTIFPGRMEPFDFTVKAEYHILRQPSARHPYFYLLSKSVNFPRLDSMR